MKKIIQSAILMVLFLCSPILVSAQTQPKKYDNPQWKRITYTDYKPGKSDRAREIINNYHLKASLKTGGGPEMVLEMSSGEWDVMSVWGMKGGISDMDWQTSPGNIAWRNAMNELAGGADKAQAIIDELNSLVDRSTTHIGRVR